MKATYTWGDSVILAKLLCSEYEQTKTIKNIHKAIDVVESLVHYRDSGEMKKFSDKEILPGEDDLILDSGEFDPIPRGERAFKSTYHILKSYIS